MYKLRCNLYNDCFLFVVSFFRCLSLKLRLTVKKIQQNKKGTVIALAYCVHDVRQLFDHAIQGSFYHDRAPNPCLNAWTAIFVCLLLLTLQIFVGNYPEIF